MAAPKGKPADKGKSADKAKKQFHINSIYDNGKAKNKSCPKCGPGVFLANHKDRESCGKCSYTAKKV